MKPRSISENESILLQSFANVSFLLELSNNRFLESNYFKNLNFQDSFIKQIMKESDIGNPAMMQMMLYSLLVIPKEILSRESLAVLDEYFREINPQIFSLVETTTTSTYNGENDNENIDYIRHIRNAVAHSKCKFNTEDTKCFVTFHDDYQSSECDIKIKCSKVGIIIDLLRKAVTKYFN